MTAGARQHRHAYAGRWRTKKGGERVDGRVVDGVALVRPTKGQEGDPAVHGDGERTAGGQHFLSGLARRRRHRSSRCGAGVARQRLPCRLFPYITNLMYPPRTTGTGCTQRKSLPSKMASTAASDDRGDRSSGG